MGIGSRWRRWRRRYAVRDAFDLKPKILLAVKAKESLKNSTCPPLLGKLH
jgi:hypothetical protein